MRRVFPVLFFSPLATLFSASLLTLLAACGTATPTVPASATPAPVSQPVPPAGPLPRPTLAAEQVRLAGLFRGTPVVFAMQQDGSLRATVPRRFGFDAGAVKVKPPLAAVLDRLAKSQSPASSRLRVSAPSDPETRGLALARDRALSVRDHLIGQGIAATRLQATGVAQTEQIEIVVSEPAH